MKNIIIITIVFISFFSCKAQQNIIPLFVEEGQEVDDPHINDYFKDVDNDYNPYVGRWKWESGNNSLEIIFNKITHNDMGDGDSSDDLVGEYKYVENGAVLVNSFPSLIQENTSGVPNIINEDNSILSYDITTDNKGFPPCPECTPNTRFIFLYIGEKNKPAIFGKIRMARFTESGVEKIRMRITNSFNDNNDNEVLSVPENSIWTLTKVN